MSMRSIEAIGGFAHEHLVIEFISYDDPMVRQIKRRPGLDYGWYTLDNPIDAVGRYYRNVSVLDQLCKTRTVILASQK